jgi:hypothetical protein
MLGLVPSLTRPTLTGVPVADLTGPSTALEFPEDGVVLEDEELLPPPHAAVTTAMHAIAARALRPNARLTDIKTSLGSISQTCWPHVRRAGRGRDLYIIVTYIQ